MLVKAKWNVKGSDGWHMTGEVFDAKEDFGDAVERLEAPKKAEAAPVKEPETVKSESAEEVKAEETKQRTPNRRRNGR